MTMTTTTTTRTTTMRAATATTTSTTTTSTYTEGKGSEGEEIDIQLMQFFSLFGTFPPIRLSKSTALENTILLKQGSEQQEAIQDWL